MPVPWRVEGPREVREGRRVLTLLVVGGLLGASMTALSLPSPASADPPTGGSTIVDETFTGATVPDAGWSIQGDTCLTGAASGATPPAGAAQIPSCVAHRNGPVPPMGGAPNGYLQLTDTAGNRAGSILYNRPIPASAGVSVTFEQYQYGGNGADGIGFFLVDGSTSLTATGGLGGSLGYAQRNSEPGVVGGYLGVGLDAYGNFYNDGEGRGAGCPAGQRAPTTVTGPIAPNVITLRGRGSGLIGYCWLDSTVPKPITNPTKPGTTLNGGTGTLRADTLAASKRTVNVQVTPVTAGNPVPRVIVQVQYVDGGPWITELDIPAPPDAPTTYKFGFSASTGGNNDVHLIRAAQIDTILPLPNLQLEKQVDRTGAALPPVITAGTVIPYQYTVTNTGEPVTGMFITDDKIPTASITCDATSLTTAPAPGSSTVCRGSYTVTAADVAAGQVVNIATAHAAPQSGGTVVSPPATVTIPLVASISIAKTVATAPPYAIGQQVSYSYTVTNTGGSDLLGIVITDDRVPLASISCPVARLAPGASTVCTGTHTIQPGQINAAGYLVNTASVRSATPIGQIVTAGPVQAQIPVSTDVGVTKTVDDAAPLVGQNVTFTVTATNNGPSVATGVIISDVLPDGDPVGSVVYQSSTTTAGTTYDPATGAWAIPSLTLGQIVTLTITATVNTGTPFTNSATRTRTDQPDRNPNNDRASATVNPITPTMDIAVTKSVDEPQIPLGGTAVFTIDATNNGPFAATGVQVSDLLPPGLAFASSSGPGAYDPATGVWAIGALGVNQTVSRTITVTGTALGTFVNIAALTGNPSPPDINPANNSDTATLTVVRPESDLAIVKAVFPQVVTVGQEVTYQLAASNLGPDTALQVTVGDVFPAGVTILSATTTTGTISADAGTWTIGTITPGQTGITATVTARIEAPGTLVNTATISSPVVDDPNLLNNSSAATVTSGEPDLDIAVGKSVSVPSGASPDAVPVGEQVEFTITAENIPGPTADAATEVVLTDILPTGLTFVSSSGDGTYDPATGLWTLDSIASGSTATHTIVATVTQPIAYVNTVTLTSLTQNDTDPTNNSASAGVIGLVVADLQIVKDVSPAVSRPGANVTYTVTVTNNGPNDATGVVAFDPLMPAAVIVSVDATVGTFDPVTRRWDIGTLAVGDSAVLTVVIVVQNPGWHRNVVVVLGLDQTDPDLENNVDDADLFVPAADIVVAKRVDQPTVYVGDQITFTVDVWNYGPDPSGPVVVNDILPAGLTYVSSEASVGTYDAVTGVWLLPSFAPANLPGLGRDAPPPHGTLRIVATVDADGTFENTATSDRTNAPIFDPDLTNNTASAVVTATPRPAELHVTKSVDRPSVQAGGAVLYTMTVSNAGPAEAADVRLVDPFPTGVMPTSSPTGGCVVAAATLTCDLGTIAVGATVSIEVVAIVSAVGTFDNTATITSSTPLLPISTLTASASVLATSPPDTGGGALPPTGGAGPGLSPLAGSLLLMVGIVALAWSRRRRPSS